MLRCGPYFWSWLIHPQGPRAWLEGHFPQTQYSLKSLTFQPHLQRDPGGRAQPLLAHQAGSAHWLRLREWPVDPTAGFLLLCTLTHLFLPMTPSCPLTLGLPVTVTHSGLKPPVCTLSPLTSELTTLPVPCLPSSQYLSWRASRSQDLGSKGGRLRNMQESESWETRALGVAWPLKGRSALSLSSGSSFVRWGCHNSAQMASWDLGENPVSRTWWGFVNCKLPNHATGPRSSPVFPGTCRVPLWRHCPPFMEGWP